MDVAVPQPQGMGYVVIGADDDLEADDQLRRCLAGESVEGIKFEGPVAVPLGPEGQARAKELGEAWGAFERPVPYPLSASDNSKNPPPTTSSTASGGSGM